MTTAAPAYLTTGADFSPCRTWRYALWRTWDETKPPIAFIGLNPSTADETKDDPTIRRCIGFAKAWGYGTYMMLNLFAFRATDPRVMKSAADPVGPENDAKILAVASACPIVIAAWGVHGMHQRRDTQVGVLLAESRLLHKLHCLGLTKGEHPKHPLYLPKTCKPMPFIRPKVNQ